MQPPHDMPDQGLVERVMGRVGALMRPYVERQCRGIGEESAGAMEVAAQRVLEAVMQDGPTILRAMHAQTEVHREYNVDLQAHVGTMSTSPSTPLASLRRIVESMGIKAGKEKVKEAIGSVSLHSSGSNSHLGRSDSSLLAIETYKPALRVIRSTDPFGGSDASESDIEFDFETNEMKEAFERRQSLKDRYSAVMQQESPHSNSLLRRTFTDPDTPGHSHSSASPRFTRVRSDSLESRNPLEQSMDLPEALTERMSRTSADVSIPRRSRSEEVHTLGSPRVFGGKKSSPSKIRKHLSIKIDTLDPLSSSMESDIPFTTPVNESLQIPYNCILCQHTVDPILIFNGNKVCILSNAASMRVFEAFMLEGSRVHDLGFLAGEAEEAIHQALHRKKRTRIMVHHNNMTFNCLVLPSHSRNCSLVSLTMRNVTDFVHEVTRDLNEAINASMLYKILAEYTEETIAIQDVNPEAHVSYVTSSCEQLLGFPNTHIADHAILDLVVSEDRESLMDAWRTLLTEDGLEKVVCTARFVHMEGHLVSIDCSLRKLEWLDIVIVALRDVTSRKLQEEETRKRQVAEASAAFREHQLSFLAHVVRNPLNGIFGNAEALSLSSLCKEELELVNMILMCSHELHRAVDDIMTIYDVFDDEEDASPLEPVTSAFELSSIFNTIASQIAPAALLKNIRVQKEVNCDTVLLGDVVRIQQIVATFAHNAVTHTSRHRNGMIQIQGVVEDPDGDMTHIRIHVRDTGRGMNATKLAEVDQSAWPVSSSEAGTDVAFNFSQRGRGMGIAICKRLARAIQGTIHITSKAGFGSCFTLVVPVRIQKQQMPTMFRLPSPFTQRRAIEDASDEELLGLVKGCRILVIDDEPVNVKLLKRGLSRLGFQVETGLDGSDMVRMLLDEEQTFDLVLLDQMMKFMSGTEALAQVRARATDDRVPVIMVTANVTEQYEALYFEAGADGVLEKPISMKTLGREISLYILDPNRGFNWNRARYTV